MKKLALGFIVFAVLATVVSVLWYKDNARLEELYKNPKEDDIYIFQEDDIYAPMRVAFVANDFIRFNQYLFNFGQAVPDRELILDDEWSSFDATYERSELDRLWEEDVIAEIYRD